LHFTAVVCILDPAALWSQSRLAGWGW